MYIYMHTQTGEAKTLPFA